MRTAWEELYSNIDKLSVTERQKSTIKDIIKLAYRERAINFEDLNTRKRHVVETNSTIATVIREQFQNISLQAIGSIFNKNHATIIHYQRSYYDFLFKDKLHSSLHKRLSDVCLNEVYGADIVVDLDTKTKSWMQEKLAEVSAENVILKRKLDKMKTTMEEVLDA